MSFATCDRHCRTCYRFSHTCSCGDEAFSISKVVDKGVVCPYWCSAFLRTYWYLFIHLGHGTCELYFFWSDVFIAQTSASFCHSCSTYFSRRTAKEEFLSSCLDCHRVGVFSQLLRSRETSSEPWK